MEIIDDRAADRHWGSYDAVDHGYDARMQSPFGQERDVMLPPGPPAPVGPDWGQILGAAWQQQGDIKVLKQPAPQVVLAALAFMRGPAQPPGVAPTSEWLSVPQTIPNAWAQSYLGAGYTLLIDVVSPLAPDGSRAVAIVPPGGSAVSDVRSRAAGKFAVVDGPREVIEAAASTQWAKPPLDCYWNESTGESVCPGQQPPAQAGLSQGKKVLIVGGIILASALVAGWFAPRYR